MKLLHHHSPALSSVVLLWASALSAILVGVEGTVSPSCDGKRSTECRNTFGCAWRSGNCVSTAPAPAPAPAAPIPCPSRSNGQCESDDGLCQKVKGNCQNVHGAGTQDAACNAIYTQDSEGFLIYIENQGAGCAAGLVCNVVNTSLAGADVDVPILGVCEPEVCLGKKVPGNCNGNSPAVQARPECNATTERVTICHRTCSAKNPWVRITIDEDAWNGEGCGHKQHDVRDECKNKAPWDEWGLYRRDYLLKKHGTRAEVAVGKSTSEIKAYWKKWERACPYVRNGACCSWDDPENPCCGEEPSPSSSPSPPAPGVCPFVTLNFTELINPMAALYGQTPHFQAGDYLYDQLWWSHGVKVSARIRTTGHKTAGDIFIPKWNGAAWVDSKSTHDPNNPSTGGAVRLFDTMRPTFNAANPDFSNPNCNRNNINDGDLDLGAPNEKCFVPGPGEGNGGVEFLPDTNRPNPYANCDPLGLVAIIQEGNKPCPDDTAKGGFITFTFREPTEIALTSLLDIDDGPNTPTVTLYYNNGAKVETLTTDSTGDNGLYPLNIDTAKYQDVTMVDVRYISSGSINAIKYRYCPQDPTPQIQIKKYAGPPGECNANGIGSEMKDDLYMVPSESDNWVYCYVISVPSSSEECLLNVQFQDPASIGGTPNGGYVDVTSTQPIMEKFCPDDPPRYFQGPIRVGSQAPEGPIDANVKGIGEFSGQQVTDKDPARVGVEIDIATAAPTDCPVDMGETDETICPNADAVSLLSIKADNNHIIPEGLDPTSIFYQLEFVGTDAAPEVSFKLDSPFAFDVDIYIQYHKKAAGSSRGALDPACIDRPMEPDCNPDAESVAAGCIHGLDGGSFALVTVFFVSDESIFGEGGDNVTPYQCCPIPDEDANKPIIAYEFKILCECPPAPTGDTSHNHQLASGLRGGGGGTATIDESNTNNNNNNNNMRGL